MRPPHHQDEGIGEWHNDGQYLGPIAAVYLLRRFMKSGLLPQVPHHKWGLGV